MSDGFVPRSHPDDGPRGEVELLTHLEDVATRAVTVTPEETKTPARESLVEVVETIGLVHDLGKATEWFQQHIDVLNGSPPSRIHKEHAPAGAFAAYHALDSKGFADETCLAGFVAVWWHHGPLPDVVKAVFDRTNGKNHSKRRDVIEEQVENIDTNVPEFTDELFDRVLEQETWNGFVTDLKEGDLIASVEDQVSRGFGHTKQAKETALSDKFYGLVLRCWGTLVLADKTSAAGAPKDDRIYGGSTPSFDRLDRYVDDLERSVTVDESREGRLNRLRSEARSEILGNVEDFINAEERVATLTLPTGLGKTLTGLSAALKLRDETNRDRVVYALPFTSIIDQVADEVRDIYADGDGGEGSALADLLTVHHYLADTAFDFEDSEQADLNDRVAGMLGESWRSGLTITTFVQLFESLAGPRNSQSMKLPALHDSVIVLDEPQSLPHDWWKLVDRLGDILTDQYNATIISMTATQPHLFRNEYPLVDDRDQYFSEVERVRYRVDDSVEQFVESTDAPLSYENAASRLTDSLEEGKSTLAICNTIDSTRKLTDATIESLDLINLAEVYEELLRTKGRTDSIDPEFFADRIASETSGAVFCHLTTRIRPVDRLTLIETIKELLDRGIQTLVISTQLVEAGVDISFDRVYRDLAPLDGIVQAAGRCNRSFELERGDVTVWRLAATDDQKDVPSDAVYQRTGPSLLSDTATVLDRIRDGDSSELTETKVSVEGVEEYYRLLDEERNVGKEEYVEYVNRGEAGSMGELSLIDERQTADILVCRTRSEFEITNEIHQAFESFDFQRVRNLIDRTRSFRISVPIYDNDSEMAQAVGELNSLPDSEIFVLDARPGHEDQYFDPTKGFVVPEDRAEARFF